MWDALASLAIALLDYAIRQGAKPKVLYDAKTPIEVRAAWAAYLNGRLRDKNGGH